MKNIRPIAIYLPQFHPIPENDEWWGKGFTEWTNVAKARPKFRDHYQPHLPSDLGFYDLRVPEVRQQQADLARQYGIYGFCYYHYWFNGKRLLERPFEEVFHSGKPDFPFMLCWANGNWTRIWDGGEKHILLEQRYSEEDDIAHINALIPYFRDERYIRVDGRPVFIIFEEHFIPRANETIRIFRQECAKAGIDLYLCKFERGMGTLGAQGKDAHFDAAIEFQPLSISFARYSSHASSLPKYLNPVKYGQFIQSHLLHHVTKPDSIIPYEKFIRFDLAYHKTYHEETPGKLYPGVSPSWDNAARRVNGGATIFTGSTPQLFKEWVSGKVAQFEPFSPNENFLFINAWNEWAEGNHLEPCQKWGHDYLQAFYDGLYSG